jgi:hypothetical protein
VLERTTVRSRAGSAEPSPTSWAKRSDDEDIAPAGRARSEPSTATVDHGHDEDVVFPPDNLDQLLALGRFSVGHTEPGLLVGPDGEQIPLHVERYCFPL